MIISLIAAVSENNVIGNNGKIPWHLPADFAYFKKTTWGHHVVMGQTTFESIGKPLPGRTNIILSFDKDYKAPGCKVVDSLDKSFQIAASSGEEELFVIGGASVYAQTIEMADKLYITKVHHKFSGDTHFPTIDPKKWKKVSETKNKKDDKNKYDFSFLIYEKK
jgi:dihydrofolate reductase